MATDGVWGIAMVRNEADIIATTVAHMLTQVDHVLVADNLSDDDTPDILAASGAEVVADTDPAYRQAEKMTALAHRAAENGATWVVPFDADEVWVSPHGRIGDVLADIPEMVAEATLFDHVPTATDMPLADPVARIGWRRRTPGAFPKVACRTDPTLVIEMGNHAATYRGTEPTYRTGALTIHHYPYRSPAQFIAKAKQGAAALRLARLPRSAGLHWRQYAELAERDGDAALEAVFTQWFYSADPTSDPTLTLDPVRL